MNASSFPASYTHTSVWDNRPRIITSKNSLKACFSIRSPRTSPLASYIKSNTRTTGESHSRSSKTRTPMIHSLLRAVSCQYALAGPL